MPCFPSPVLIFFLLLPIVVRCRQCRSSDFTYHFTNCDAQGQRWRYAVPKSHFLAGQCENSPPPIEGLNCSFSCSAGNYLDMETQQCRACPPGQYSLGEGIRYEQFAEMPQGFFVENYPDESDQPMETTESRQNQDDEANVPISPVYCSNQVGWVVQNEEMRYTPTPCISKLSISLNLVRDGYIEFYYKMPRNRRSLVSILQVKNAQCQNYGDLRSVFFQSSRLLTSSRPTGDEDVAVGDEGFRLRRIHIKAGQNLLTWTVAPNNREFTTLADIIHIPKIDIFGLAFTPSCTKCPSGTFSGNGAQKCDSCHPGTFSLKGSSRCEICNEMEYSGQRAHRCKRRPNCQDFDFYPVRSAACQNHLIHLSYEKLKPLICIDGGIRPGLKFSHSENCAPCPAGMARHLSSGKCEYCNSDNEYSDAGQDCKRCQRGSIPEAGYFFTRWDVLPAEITTTCEYISPDEENQQCETAPAWIPLGDRIESSQTREVGVALELSLRVPGFFNPLVSDSRTSAENPIGHISIEIETVCADQTCQLYFVQEHNNDSIHTHFNIIAALNGTQRRQTFHYPIVENGPTKFVVAFMRSGSAIEYDAIMDRAILYSLNVSHVGNSTQRRHYGGAAKCVKCPIMEGNECRPCALGQYWNEPNNTCIKCPPGTALNITSSRIGLQSCVICGSNLGSEDGSSCIFSGQFQMTDEDGQTMKFDLSPLKNKTLTAEGIKVYAREGNSYFHTFNLSLFGEDVQCQDSFDSMSSDHTNSQSQANVASDAVFCRSAAIPATTIMRNASDFSLSSNMFSKVLYVSTTIISRKLAAITKDRNFRSFHLSNEQLEYDSTLASNARPIDVHFFFEPMQSVGGRLSNCPHGTLGVVTLRCEPTVAKSPLVRLSRKCPDGTCDGCLYHVIVETSFACPICHFEDFEEIRGECINNVQHIHFIPSKHCVLSGAQNRRTEETCSNLTKNIKLMLLVAALVIASLGVTVVVFYQRNKSLEYRYMRIIEGKEPDNVHTCGLDSEDEEEEEEDVVAGTRVFFGKKKNKNYVLTGVASKDPKKAQGTRANNRQEMTEFLSESSDED